MRESRPRNYPACRAAIRLWLGVLCAPASVSGATLQQLVDQAVTAFTGGEYHESYWTFESIELDFGMEPEFLEPEFQKTILPVRAYAAMMADRPTDALIHFQTLLADHEVSPGLRGFALYNTAIALSQVDALAQATAAFREFRTSFAGSKEAHLACLQEADLLAEIGEVDAADGLLQNFYESEAPESLRMQGRLRALQIASETGDSERVHHLLFETDWQVASMPDIAVLSFAAVQAGDLLLENHMHAEAVRAYRLSLPRDKLIEKQRERLSMTKHAFRQQAALASSIWKSHYSQLISRLERQLARLEAMADYTPGLYLRRGQAYLLGKRFREASILFRTIAQSDEYDKALRAQAHYRWILALNAAENWDEARRAANTFVRRHPDHSLTNSALFLIARAYQGEGAFSEAIGVLDDLIAKAPKDRQAPRWYFTRGYNYSVLEDQGEARANFEAAVERYPDSELVTQLKMWAALTFFFDRNYESALTRLQALTANSRTHPLYPEIRYRTANVLYAMRKHEEALAVIETLIQKFPEHYRYAETLALKGDIYMGLGELVTAAHAFQKVPADDRQLYDYAVFQAAKIYRALEHYDLLRKHLRNYIARDDARERPRVSEALYWIGWSFQQEDRAKESFPLFEEALDRFGDDPEARAVESILSAYADLYRREHTEGEFKVWLQNTTEASLAAGELTWFARLTKFASQRQRRAKDHDRADARLLSIHRLVPIEQQDAPTLASVGVVLAERGYGVADDYFERILNEYPDHFERGAAFYGKALLASQKDHLDESRRWLVRFLEECPTHHLAADTRLLAAEVLRQQGLYDAAAQGLNEILQLKAMRGRPHAEALAGLARIETDRENWERAIPYWQRIYTLYRAYPDLLAEAYWESALLFQKIDDPIAAHNTIVEMLKDERLEGFERYGLAKTKLPEIEAAARSRKALAEQKPPGMEEEATQ